ncbi:hypothetical protein LTR70_001544 [Exophiala xenobiotica]|nr:hypothetical protein LTR70_001544 [Exophiala xenobiotica]
MQLTQLKADSDRSRAPRPRQRRRDTKVSPPSVAVKAKPVPQVRKDQDGAKVKAAKKVEAQQPKAKTTLRSERLRRIKTAREAEGRR